MGERLDRLHDENSYDVTGNAAKIDLATRATTVDCLWSCLLHHWKQAASIDGPWNGDSVIRRVQSGKGFAGKGNLGGNPFRDIVLAKAVLSKNELATNLFVNEFQEYLQQVGGKVDQRFCLEVGWWSEFMDYLAGYTSTKGKLKQYHGKSGLKFWLGTVVRNFLLNLAKRDNKVVAFEETRHIYRHKYFADIISIECYDLIGSHMKQTINRLEKDSKLVLLLRYEQELNGEQIANVLGIHPGTVTRRIQKATSWIEQAFSGSSNSDVKDCVDHLLADSGTLSLGKWIMDSLRGSDSEVAI